MTSKNSCDINAKDDDCCCSSSSSDVNYKSHWDAVYTKSEVSKLGWYEKESTQILQLIENCNLHKNDPIFVVGAGSTTLIDSLISDNFTNLIANDISKEGLETLKKRIRTNSDKVTWIVDDLVNPKRLNQMSKIKLWVDRAVLHFFIEEQEQDIYFNLLKEKVSNGGFVILAEFNLSGATKCSGLPVKHYDDKILSSKLGSNFNLLNSFDYVYTMPNGNKRNYVYTLFKRID